MFALQFTGPAWPVHRSTFSEMITSLHTIRISSHKLNNSKSVIKPITYRLSIAETIVISALKIRDNFQSRHVLVTRINFILILTKKQ